MAKSLPGPTLPAKGDLRSVLSIVAFRRLWWNLSLSSFGDWMGLLATTALAKQFAGSNYAKANVAIAGVFILRLLPSVVIGPLAGVIADRFDRRRLMVTGDTVRGLLTISIPLVHTYWWLYTCITLIEIVGLFWSPAKDATVPNLVPKERLQAAYQASLIGTYGSAPIAAALFSLMAVISNALALHFPFFKGNPVDLAIFIDGVTGFYSAYTIYHLKQIPKIKGRGTQRRVNVLSDLVEGWRFIGKTAIIRGLIMGMFGAFVAGGAIIGLGRTFATDLGGGNAAYGVLFGAIFLGIALGMWLGPRLFSQFARQSLFGLSLMSAGLSIIALSLIPILVVAIFMTTVIGFCAGIAWVTGFTTLGAEVSDAVRGRTFGFVESLVRITLISTLAATPLLAAAIGRHVIAIRGYALTFNGIECTLLIAGIFDFAVGLGAYRQMRLRKNN